MVFESRSFDPNISANEMKCGLLYVPIDFTRLPFRR